MFVRFRNPKIRTVFAVATAILFAFCFLYLVLTFNSSGNTVAKHESVKSDSKPVILKGEEANKRIKNNPEYKSLQEAMQESFYRVEKDSTGKKDAYYANNRLQAMSVSFEKGEAVLRVKRSNSKESNRKDSVRKLKQAGETQRARRVESDNLKIRFISAGYGDKLQTVSGESAIVADKNRLTYKHKLSDESSLEEWYVNESSGIEHGFTLSEPLLGGTANDKEKLRLKMSLDSEGKFKVRVGGDGRGLILTDGKGREISYGGLKVFDSDNKQLESSMSYVRGSVTIEFSDSGAKYPVTIDPVWTEVKKLTASDAASNDFFGNSVSINGDTAIVGAFQDTGSAGTQQGSAYIYERNQGGANNWGEVKHIFASDAVLGDQFGISVSISGDTAIVGAYVDAGSAGGSQGSAYIYDRNTGGANNWGEVKHLFASDAAPTDSFGISVSISVDTAIVGANVDDGSAGFNQGSAYIFERNQGGANNWGEVKHLFASDAGAGDNFGNSVSISGDTAIVGANWDAGSAGTQQGSAYIFERNQGGANNWGEMRHLFASDAAADDNFGNSVSINGDTAIVGAFQDDGSEGSNQGSAYIYERNQGGANNWGEVKHIFASDAVFGDQFGISVSISGDTAIVGAFQDDGSAGTNQGSAYIYKRNQGGANNWGEVKHLFASDAGAGDHFGKSVSVNGDTVIIGAYLDGGSAGAIQGSAYIFTITNKKTPLDFDGDGKADYAVVQGTFPKANGEKADYFVLSSDMPASERQRIRERAYDKQLYLSSGRGFVELPKEAQEAIVKWKQEESMRSNDKPTTEVAVVELNWHIRLSGTGTTLDVLLGSQTDEFVPADYDGDGKADVAVWTGTQFRIKTSSSNFVTTVTYTLGTSGSNPTVVGDYDGDGLDDPAVYDSSTGLWSWLGGASHNSLQSQTWMPNGIPAPGDYNGDGKLDFAAQVPPGASPDSAKFRIAYNDGSVGPAADLSITYGLAIFAIVPGDYDGDGKCDIAQANLTGSTINWRILTSSSNYTMQIKRNFGTVSTDRTVQGDYDGDGKIDIAIYRRASSPNDGVFIVFQSSTNTQSAPFDWGEADDYPVGFYNSH